jgi:hypothetical protein
MRARTPLLAAFLAPAVGVCHCDGLTRTDGTTAQSTDAGQPTDASIDSVEEIGASSDAGDDSSPFGHPGRQDPWPWPCATWDTLNAKTPTAWTTAPGNTDSLTASAGADDPALLTFAWSASAGTITGATWDDAGNSTATFTCPQMPGIATITLFVGDGPLPDGQTCPSFNTTGTVTVTCEVRSEDGGPTDSAAD